MASSKGVFASRMEPSDDRAVIQDVQRTANAPGFVANMALRGNAASTKAVPTLLLGLVNVNHTEPGQRVVKSTDVQKSLPSMACVNVTTLL
mmetsp:Transcript_6607/g.14626  ORF Transcript_6607/g.14626 Transcript_6607/m.14626 type:complete len:91 (-) Transcript_6607:656-928(-)